MAVAVHMQFGHPQQKRALCCEALLKQGQVSACQVDAAAVDMAFDQALL